MAVIKGKEINFYITINSQRQVFCHATDWQLSTSTDTNETTGPGNGAWKTFIPGMLSYTMSVPGVVTFTDELNIAQIDSLQFNRTTIEWYAGVQPNGGYQYHGNAFITSINRTSQMNDSFKFDCSLQGTGILEALKNPFIKNVYLSDKTGNRLPGCPNPYPVGVLWYDDTLIGIANNAGEVVTIFNTYAASVGAKYRVIGTLGGCDFTLEVDWDSPDSPDYIIATTGAGFVLGGTVDPDVIGGTEDNNDVIGQ